MGQFPPGAFTDPAVVVAQVSNEGPDACLDRVGLCGVHLGVELKDLNNTFPSNPELPHRLEPYSDMTYLLPGSSGLGGRLGDGLGPGRPA